MNKLQILKNIKSYILISFIVSLCMFSCVGDRMKGSGWATPFVEGENVYIGTIEGELISIDIMTAKENWRATSFFHFIFNLKSLQNHFYLIVKYLLELLRESF